MADLKSDGRRAAHRPSRRDDIIEAAIRVFAERGFAEASLGDIAEAADVAVSAIYYHFSGGKEELFDTAIERVYESLDQAIESARPSADQGSPEALTGVIAAGNRWVDQYPLSARMLYTHLPGATEHSEALRVEHEARHVDAAHVYLRAAREMDGSPTQLSAADELAARTLVHLMISIMPLRLEGGPLSKRSTSGLVASAQAVGRSIVFDD